MYFDRTQNRYRSSQTLYEINYALLDHFLPEFLDSDTVCCKDETDSISLTVNLLERSPYTSLVELVLAPISNIKLVSKSHFTVRIYHDVKVAEVVEYQGKRRFHAWYAHYPNTAMYTKDEKRQVNLLLSEMLKFCETSGISFEHLHVR
ncbi:MAG: DUF1249 domain-containing protein [Gammaproteobacteria bacterium]|nr:DUF1249 domain-containing protein [Gammaproteobacteria bacterium]MDH5693009.1 DUF1249 domain-containing protein [Gammaproteobacteria bacterium]